MKLTRDLIWTNVRPISAEEEARVLRRFNAVEQCFGAPGWAGFDDVAPPDRERVTIICGRCQQPHSYLAYTTAARRKYCDACVRT
jgi:uncharacterized CHY-type Zn-finger protein